MREKAGLVTDRAGDPFAWNGSLNGTAAGWPHRGQSITPPEFVAGAGEDDLPEATTLTAIPDGTAGEGTR